MLRTLLLGLTLLPLVQPSPARAQEGDVAAVRAILEQIPTLAMVGDFASLDALYAPGRGVHIIEGAGVNHGWEEYRDHHLKPEFESFENMRYQYFAIGIGAHTDHGVAQ